MENKVKDKMFIVNELIVLLKEGPLTRDQLVKKMNIPRTTIYDGLRILLKCNKVKKFPVYLCDRPRGRPKVLFSLIEG
jgi:predicted transcriptional regulator